MKDRLLATNALLAPSAVPHEGKLGRIHPEPDDPMRFPFQRDRGRILHTQAFRRLQGKTQVFVAGEGDHYRTRLTHTMEVAQISRDLARTLRLNEDLTECIALAHDLGHPPFGHSGEDALNEWMLSQGSHFEHNEQSLRIVTLLETHSDLFPGLNLNREILDGLEKHSGKATTIEAELVNRADEIAYTCHDCDDGLTGGLFLWEELLTVPLAARAAKMRQARGTSIRGALIRILAEDLIETSTDCITRDQSPHIALSPALQTSVDALRSFLERRMYFHPSILARTQQGKEIVLRLCNAYLNAPTDKILALQKRTDSTLAEAVKDYVAGMTDAYAEAQASLLLPLPAGED